MTVQKLGDKPLPDKATAVKLITSLCIFNKYTKKNIGV